MFGNKKFKPNAVFDHNLNPLPENLRKSLDLIGLSYNSARMRNLNIMENSERRLYGFMTNYDGNNFFWIQPTRVKSKEPEVEYDRYIKRINKDARAACLAPIENIEVGDDCIAAYEADSHWYRAMVVGEQENGKWLVLFVDYGNFQRCIPHHIAMPINDPKCDHFHAPMQAVCCRLYNIIPKLPNLREEIDIKLESFYTAHSTDLLEIIVKNVRPDFVIDCDIFLCKTGVIGENRLYRRHIGQELVDTSLAYFADPEAAHSVKVVSDQHQKEPLVPCINIDDDDLEIDQKMSTSNLIKTKSDNTQVS